MRYIVLFISLIIFSIPVNASSVFTNTFVVQSSSAVTIDITGNFNADISGEGILSAPLTVNFNVNSNEALSDVRLHAQVTNSSDSTMSAFYCTNNTPTTSESAHLVLANSENKPTDLSISNCKQPSSTHADNPNAIAYPATVTIDNGGQVQFVDNSGNGYFSCSLNSGVTNINMALGTNFKPGTYSRESLKDSNDTYKVEIFLDNVP